MTDTATSAFETDKARATREAVARAEQADCETIQRLLALKPGEELRYLTEDPHSTSGPACRALIARIKDFARGLQLQGRVELKEVKRVVGKKRTSPGTIVVDFIALGVERRQ